MKVRVKKTGRVVNVDPIIAEAMLQDGTAELIRNQSLIETTTAEPQGERMVLPQQNPPRRKRTK